MLIKQFLKFIRQNKKAKARPFTDEEKKEIMEKTKHCDEHFRVFCAELKAHEQDLKISQSSSFNPKR